MSIHKKILLVISSFNNKISTICRYVALSLVCLMTFIILIQVVSRYLIGHALSWPEEVAKFMMVWVTFLIAPYAYRHDINVRIRFLSRRLKGRLAIYFNIFIDSIVLFLALLLLEQGINMTLRGHFIEASSVAISMDVIYIVMPFSFVMIAAVSLEKILDQFKLILDGNFSN